MSTCSRCEKDNISQELHQTPLQVLREQQQPHTQQQERGKHADMIQRECKLIRLLLCAKDKDRDKVEALEAPVSCTQTDSSDTVINSLCGNKEWRQAIGESDWQHRHRQLNGQQQQKHASFMPLGQEQQRDKKTPLSYTATESRSLFNDSNKHQEQLLTSQKNAAEARSDRRG